MSVSILRFVSRYHSYINTATQIIESYNGKEPLSSYLKKFFAAEKKYGSTDRKTIAHCCYVFFRMGRALPDMPVDEKILTALYLFSNQNSLLLQQLRPDWNDKLSASLPDKILSIDRPFELKEIFPWQHLLSDKIDYQEFCESFLKQPDLFIRIRPNQKHVVVTKLQSRGIGFREVFGDAFAIDNSQALDAILELDKEAVIQDLSSQRVSELYPKLDHEEVWDCCAASGGKSIHLTDTFPKVRLTATDIRDSILANLRKRFERAGLKNYKALTVDLSNNSDIPFKNESFDFIMADVPCTGSGTWSRTPEQLFYFDLSRLDSYSQLQRNIISNVIPRLKKGGYLLYSTCSVFRKENEDVVHYLSEEFPLQTKKMQLITGYADKADSMFVALLQKTN